MKLESLLQYLDSYLEVAGHPDYPNALNGLQVQGREEVRRIVAAVDASEASVAAAVDAGADLLVVHHGLFWDGLRPLTGRRYRRVKPLLAHGIGLYSAHLPLDSHAEVGNCALLARALGLELQGRFADYKGSPVGWWGTHADATDAPGLQARLADALGGAAIHLIAGGPPRVERVGVVTGGGASFVEEAVALGLDALVTGEGSHHTHFDAMELGIHVLFGGHYATETFGVRALAQHLGERFDLEWQFLDQPTGL
ncbi:MAG TPA: Nif3-like dinuclear metal center hexameric protein [Longimicrobiales bacterium]|nr:Nif3-like dinuclear metal center hexameric protein [Longimicrobiales bacterium]